MMQTTPRAWTDPLFLAGLRPVPGGSASVSDGVATFSAPTRAPLPNMRVALYVQQEGTGDPAPDNIRPITGNGSLEIFVAPEYDETAEPAKSILFPYPVYRGTYTPHDGKCIIRGLYQVLTGTDADGDWSGWYGSGSSRYARLEIPGYTADSSGSTSRRCSHYRNANVTSSTTTKNVFFASTPSGTTKIRVHIRPDLSEYDTMAAFKGYLAEQLAANTPVQIYVPFAEAGLFTVQLTEPQTIYALKGDNAVWCDGGTLAALDYRGGLHVSDLSMLALSRARCADGKEDAECM